MRRLMERTCPCLVAATILSLPGCASPGRLRIGTAAPPLSFEKLFQAPDGAEVNWPALDGRVVVLEFWGTYCAPCIAVIPHLNELAEKFADRPVQFVSITDEEESVVASFLEKKRLAGWVALDPDRSTFRAYGVSGVPRTVLVDRRGRLAAITYPTEVTEAVLNDMLAGKRPAVAEFAPEGPVDEAPTQPGMTGPTALLEVRIARTTQEWCGFSVGPGRFEAGGCPLEALVALAYDTRSDLVIGDRSGARVEGPPELLGERYDLVITLPEEKQGHIKSMARDALITALPIGIVREQRRTDVFVLAVGSRRSAAGLNPTASTSGSGSQIRPGQISMVNCSLDQLARQLEGILARPVVVETQLEGRYDIVLDYDAERPESVIDAVRGHLGLDVVAAQREVEIIVVKASAPPHME